MVSKAHSFWRVSAPYRGLRGSSLCGTVSRRGWFVAMAVVEILMSCGRAFGAHICPWFECCALAPCLTLHPPLFVSHILQSLRFANPWQILFEQHGSHWSIQAVGFDVIRHESKVNGTSIRVDACPAWVKGQSCKLCTRTTLWSI